MTLAAGTLNRRVSLQQKQETPTGTGGSTISWVEVAKVWANLRMLNGIETAKSDFPVSVAKASIRIRWREDIDPTWRVVYVSNSKTMTFDVKALLPDLVGREYLDLSVEVGQDDG
jgi:SPP1 family predicted phage head-tail adaptor